MSQVVERLAKLGIVLPRAAAPVANYVGAQKSGALLFVSGQLPLGPDGKLAPEYVGKLGADAKLETAAAAARQAAINVLAQAQAALGDLDRVVQVARVGGFVAVDGRFDSRPLALNGASDLFAAAFGERGRHARTTVGVAFLPLFSIVEVEAIFEFAP